MGIDGPITVRRARFQCSQSKALYCPADALLDLPPGEVTVSLARRAARLGTKMSFAELEEELREQHDVRVSDTTLDGLMNAVGAVAQRDRQARLVALEELPAGRSREEAVTVKLESPKRMYISCDGITYRTRYREADPEHQGEKRVIYQEMKVGTVFWQDHKERWHKQVVNGRENPERFGLSLWALAVECGMLKCPEVIFISDGGGWCQSVAQMYFKDALRILDWYHLVEHVWEAGRQLYPTDEAAAKRWVDTSVDHLHDSSGIGLLRHLEHCLQARGGGAASAWEKQALESLMGYVRPRLAITDYVEYRARGMVIGSGMMESTCKQVVEHRLKGNGMQWSESGALGMASLISHRLNGAWAEFWQSRPLQRAA
jgi:hypothetical protein